MGKEPYEKYMTEKEKQGKWEYFLIYLGMINRLALKENGVEFSLFIIV